MAMPQHWRTFSTHNSQKANLHDTLTGPPLKNANAYCVVGSSTNSIAFASKSLVKTARLPLLLNVK